VNGVRIRHARACRHGAFRRDRPHTQHRTLHRGARDPRGLHRREERPLRRCHGDEPARSLCRRRRS
jgi:hypothetical protein